MAGGLDGCDEFVSCDNSSISTEQLIRKTIGKNENGCPVLKVRTTNHKDNLISTLDTLMVTGSTLNDLYNDLNSKLSTNGSKKIVSFFWNITNLGNYEGILIISS